MATIIPQLLIGLGAGILSSLLIKKKSRAPVEDPGPTALAERGTYITYLIGTRLLGSTFAYAGARKVRKEKTGGGKGGLGGSKKTDVYFENGWHLLAMPGPGKRLTEIQQGGKAIFSGSITPDSHPSGSFINLGSEGWFVIYWGEDDQPVNILTQSLGVDSRWPGLCSIYWIEKRLGTTPTWPNLKYIFEVGLNFFLLQDSVSYRDQAHWAGDDVFEVVGFDDGQDRLRIGGSHVGSFFPGSFCDLTGNAAGDALLSVASSEIFYFAVFDGTSGQVSVNVFTDIYFVQDIVGADSAGLLRPHVLGRSSGYNPAHMIAQVLFGPYPYGVSLPQEDFNIDSLEALGVRLEAEDFFGSIISREDGSSLLEILGGLLQDIGTFISLNVETGKYEFIPLREIGDVVPNFSEEFFEDPDLEVDTNHLGRDGNKILFVFQDSSINFDDNTIGGYKDEGEFRLLQYFRAKKVRLVLPTDFATAAKAAERRSQEELGSGSAYKMQLNRSARLLMPGAQFTTDKSQERLVCLGKKLDVLSSKVTVTAIADFASAEASSFENQNSTSPSVVLPAVTPTSFLIVEVPAYLSQGQEVLAVPLIRAHNQIVSHSLWFSSDDVTYRQILLTSEVQTGGVLVDAIPDDTETSLSAGQFSFSALGPDLTTLVLDLSGDEAGWRAGRQLLLIGNEIMFLDGVGVSGENWTLGKVLRSRFDTAHGSHPIGTPFIILEIDSIETISESEILPGNTVYIKPQAIAADSVPLASVPAASRTLTGKGLVPMQPLSLLGRRAVAEPYSNSYEAGGSPNFTWSYHSTAIAGTGAGLQNAGSPHGTAILQGQFRVDVLTSGGTLKNSYFVLIPSWTYSNASLISDFGSEPSSFKVRVTQVEAGYESDYNEISMVKE